MAVFEGFYSKAVATLSLAGDVFTPMAVGVQITDSPVVKIAYGYYVFEDKNLDEVLALARYIPVTSYGAMEAWLMVGGRIPPQPLEGINWIALCWSRRTGRRISARHAGRRWC